jgi:hypothetical protein
VEAAVKTEERIEEEAITEKPTKPARKPRHLKVAEQPKPEPVSEPKAQPKAEAEPKAKPMPPTRYEGSLAQKWDRILEAGGSWEEMAKACDVTPGRLRAHAKHRLNRKSHTLQENGDNVKLIPA